MRLPFPPLFVADQGTSNRGDLIRLEYRPAVNHNRRAGLHGEEPFPGYWYAGEELKEGDRVEFDAETGKVFKA